MTFIHLGDLHLGKTLFEFDLVEDQKAILDQVLALAERERADAIVLAGDIYDRAIPSERAVHLLDWFLCALAQRGIPVFLIAGNHDSEERLNFGSTLLRRSGVYVSARYDGTLFHHTLTDAHGPVNFYLMPFVKAAQVRHFYEDEDINSYDDAIRVVLEQGDVDFSQRNVLVAHQFVTGGQPPVLGGSESIATQTVGQVEQVSFRRFDGFDYVALGHIHSAQSVGRDGVRYAGSPMKYSLTEVGQEKYATLVTLGEKGSLEVRLEPLKPVRDLRHIRGPMKQLLAHAVDPDDFIYVTLTDEEVIDNAMGIFQHYYPNTVRLDYDNSRTRQILVPGEDRPEAPKKEFRDIISDFYRFIYGQDISQEEQDLMQEAAKEAGIIHAAD